MSQAKLPLSSRIKKCFLSFFDYIRHRHIYYSNARYYKKLLKLRNIPNVKAEGEENYRKLWKQLSKHVEPYSYRLFRHYMGNNPRIIPEGVGRAIIEEKLNPIRYRDFYSDKSIYALYLGQNACPQTILRRSCGWNIVDAQNQVISKPIEHYLEGFQRVILKPSMDSSCGANVLCFEKSENNQWLAVGDKTPLTQDFLLQFSQNFVLQECVIQHPEMAKFNKSSVNTIRIVTYRSVRDESVNLIHAIVRLGLPGAVVDNMKAGGLCINIDPSNGLFDKFCISTNGDFQTSYNGVNFAECDIFVPNWERVQAFVKDICTKIVHLRYLSFDIAIDFNGNPKIIEINTDGFGLWPYMFAGRQPFGEFFDEVIDYCKAKS